MWFTMEACCEDNRTVRWEQSCKCTDREPVPCVVLDPFAGSGTVGEWCLNNNRRAILIELNPNTNR